MKRFLGWVAASLDALFAMSIAIVVAILGFFGTVDRQFVDGAVLLVLALIAQTVLRDRVRRDRSERAEADEVSKTAGAMDRARSAFEQTIEQVSVIRLLGGAEVGQALDEARRVTDRWHFKGGTGTYLRAKTLPECVTIARRRNATMEFRVEIIDPTNVSVCQRYAAFRQSLSWASDPSGEEWTTDRTQKEAFATILAACWYRQRSTLLDIDVRLSSTMTTLRYDMSSTCLIITQEDPQYPAVMIKSGKVYYRRWELELRNSREQARLVQLDQGREVRLDDEPTVDQTRRLFTALELPLPGSFTARDVSDIVRKAINPPSPY